jgi:hypothetical protein
MPERDPAGSVYEDFDQYFWNGGGERAEGKEGAVVGVSTGSLTEAILRAAEAARNENGANEGDTYLVTSLEITIGPNPRISQWKVVAEPGSA